MNRKLLSGGSLLIALVLLFAVNIFSNGVFRAARMDLTDNQLYTLSEGSKNILANLQEPITLRLYVSQKLAAGLAGINTYTVRVRELLEEYQRLAGGKINLLVIDPEPFSEEEDRAVGYGLQGVPLDTGNTTFYFGLAGNNSTDDEEVIAFFQTSREEMLEYDLTKLIYSLTNPKRKVVGVMSTLPIEGGGKGPMAFLQAGAQPWMIMEQLKQSFEIRTIETSAETIPPEVEILLLVHPKESEINPHTLYALDQFVLRGGRLLAFVDPYSEADSPDSDPMTALQQQKKPVSSDLKKLFDTWGVELVKDKVVGDLKAGQRVQVRKASKTVVTQYPVWISLDNTHFNKDEIITGSLEKLNFATAGALQAKENAAAQLVPLIESGEQSMLIDVAQLGPLSDPEDLARKFKSDGKKYTLAARLSGKVKTAFPDGAPKKSDEDKDKPISNPEAHLAESKDSINVVVIADTDLLQDQFWVQVQNFLGQRVAIPHSANASLVTNALENLSGSNDLISLRSRANFSRPFTRVEGIQQEVEKRFHEKEQELQARLNETEQKLRQLQGEKKDGNSLLLTPEQQQALVNFRNEKVKIRKELRDVQHESQKNIERLEATMKFINIGLMPLLVGFGGVLLGLLRARRRRALQAA